MSRRLRELLPGFAVVVLFSLPLLSEIVGTRRLVFRDAQITHWPWRDVAVAALRSGEVPFVNAAASGGEPLLANPNAVLLYPTFLLELVLPAAAAFNLHYLIHVLWAFFGARRLSRMLGLAEGPAFLSGVAFAFSGMMLSYGSAFMNSAAAAAWLPWCAAALLALAEARGLREALPRAAAAGLALGLQLLAGEPAISLLTLAFSGALCLARALAAPRAERRERLRSLVLGSAAAGVLALALAAPLLLPLRQVFPLTYRGQHLYSERAFGAGAFSAERAVEWLLPRFGGDPAILGGGANWLRAVTFSDLVYIWCVALGVIPLLLLSCAALRKEFWDSRAGLLAAGGIAALLLSFGFSLPFYRMIYSVTFLRRLRYPVKFYLVTTICVALLAGLAAESLARRRAGRREAFMLVTVLCLCAAAWALAAPGGMLDRWAGPPARAVSDDPEAFMAAFRGAVRGDALLGALAALFVALLLLRPAARVREPAYPLGLATLLLSLVWGLPLFVSAPDRALGQAPAPLKELRGPGRLFVSTRLPRFDPKAVRADGSDGLPRFSRVARVLAEQLVPLTGASFGVRYLFENDPDGSYGYYNRLASEAASASTPADRDRLLILYGARWTLTPEGEEHPLFRPRTGLVVAGERIVLSENDHPLPELRWAGRLWRRAGLSGTLELVRSARFDARGDVALPGRRDADPASGFVAATLEAESVRADSAAATVDAHGAGYVVFSRTFLPSWRARVDGRPAPVLVANARDLAVAVSAGRHRVELEYDRGPFRLGVAVQAAALLAAAIAAAAGQAGSSPRWASRRR